MSFPEKVSPLDFAMADGAKGDMGALFQTTTSGEERKAGQGLLRSGSAATSLMTVWSYNGTTIRRGLLGATGPGASRARRTQDYTCAGGWGWGTAPVTPVQSPQSPQQRTAVSPSAVRSSCMAAGPAG